MKSEGVSRAIGQRHPGDNDPLMAALYERLAQATHRPIATYRLQFNASFTFAHAQCLVSYLHSLGVSTCYASPYLRARTGSTHGYDVVDPQRLHPEVGSATDYAALVQTLRAHGMDQILDIVPNHMGVVGGDNTWWMDVLEHGPSSAYAAFFDIDWRPWHSAWQDQVLLPILGDQYGHVLERQELRLAYADGQFTLHYYDHRLPLEPRSTRILLQDCLPCLRHQLGEAHPQTLELQSILTALSYLPSYTERLPERSAERHREAIILRYRLGALHAACPVLPQAIAQTLQTVNGTAGEPCSFSRLDALLAAQPYRLSWWRAAPEAINYRRFFDINDLAGLRVEDAAVFDAAHALVLRLLAEGSISGVRIDHPDGLADPVGYMHRLQQAYVLHHCQYLLAHTHPPQEDGEAAAQALLARFVATSGEQRPPLYVVVEKILERREQLPTSWPVYGTTGYDFLNQLNGLFVDRRQAPALRSLYAAFVGGQERWPDVLYTARKLILETAMSSELHALGVLLERLAATDRAWRDLTRPSLTAALREVIACFPVYRTYIGPRTIKLTAADRTAIDTAVAEARHRNPMLLPAALDYLQATLQLQHLAATDPAAQHHQRLFIQKFQQLTGPVMAKGLEDTGLYRYTPLASLNDVGGDPDVFGLTVTAFHRCNRLRQQHWPLTLLATSTHDTKRGEDVRARLNVLSELPQVWEASLQRWHQLNRPHQPVVDGQPVPARQEEYLLYQTLLGAWPFAPLSAAALAEFRDRMQVYMRKALREAKVHTSWTLVHAAYEQAMDTFIARLLDDTVSDAFLQDFHALQTTVALYGLWNGLAQTLLKLTVPGVPDIYQGCELWDFSLVDPDNRRPVDYALRQQYLAELQQRCQEETRLKLVQDLLHTRIDGRIKLYVIWQTLTLRRAQAAVFLDGAYLPLEVQGRHAAHVCAFARVHATAEIVVVVPRLYTRLLPQAHDLPLGINTWGDTSVVMAGSLRGRQYRQLFTGRVVESSRVDGASTLSLATVLAHFPVAVLERIA